MVRSEIQFNLYPALMHEFIQHEDMSVEILERILDHTHVEGQEKEDWERLKANKATIARLIKGSKVLQSIYS